MDYFMAALAVPAFAVLFIMNSVSANPQNVGVDDPTVPFFLTLVSALSYSAIAVGFLHALGLGEGIKHLWLLCLPFSLILATAVYLYSAQKRESPFGRKKSPFKSSRMIHPPRQSASHSN